MTKLLQPIDSRVSGAGRRLGWAAALAALLLAAIAFAAFGWAGGHARTASDIAAAQQP